MMHDTGRGGKGQYNCVKQCFLDFLRSRTLNNNIFLPYEKFQKKKVDKTERQTAPYIVIFLNIF